MPKELFDIFEGHPFDGDHCFLCGVHLNASNRTVEHVFPRWLQDAFDLWDQQITLLNQTYIPYRNLVIPCCQQCNRTHLSQLERRVRSVVLDDSRSLDELSDQDLNTWLSKIYIGIHWKELELKFDRKAPDSDPILRKEGMEGFRTVHFFMQSCRKTMKFNGLNRRFPSSLLRVQCKAPQEVRACFDYLDNFWVRSVGIRLGGKGIFGVFDGGLHSHVFPDFSEMQFDKKPLHPIQFQEIFAKLTCKAGLALRIPYFGIIQEAETDNYVVSLMAFDDHNKGASCAVIGSEEGPIVMVPILPKAAQEGAAYSEWSQETYANVLSRYTGYPLEELFCPPDLVRSFLRDHKGDFLDIPLEATY